MGLKRILWSIVIGIPLGLICLIGYLASLVCWDWLEERMIDWFEDISTNS